MKFYRLMIVLAILSMMLAGCKAKDEEILAKNLFLNNDYKPESSLLIEEVKDEISSYMSYEKENLEIEELTNEQLWKNKKIQVFRIKNDCALSDSMAIYEDGELLELFSGQNMLDALLADIDGDNEYELCMNFTDGFGYSWSRIVVYDFEAMMKHEYSAETNLIMDISSKSKTIDIFTNDDSKEPVIHKGENGVTEIELINKYLGCLKLVENELGISE